MVDEAEGGSARGGDRVAGEHMLHRELLRHLLRKAEGTACRGEQSDLDLGQAELGMIRRDDDVAHQRNLAPAAEGDAVDRGDDRLRDRMRDPAGKAPGPLPGLRSEERSVGKERVSTCKSWW